MQSITAVFVRKQNPYEAMMGGGGGVYVLNIKKFAESFRRGGM
jgi:hypothetical protein